MRWRTVVRASDALAVRELVADTGFFSPEEVEVAVELVDETLSRGKASGYEFLFADADDDNDTLLGYTCYGQIPATESSFDLYWIAVSPQNQRNGLGRKLLVETEGLARDQGASQMFVDTGGKDQYSPTRAFYEAMGYRCTARLDNFFAIGDAKHIYVKAL